MFAIPKRTRGQRSEAKPWGSISGDALERGQGRGWPGVKETPAQRKLWAALPLPGEGSLGCSITLLSSSSPPCVDWVSSEDPRLWEAGSAAETPAWCPPRLHYCLPLPWAGSS